MTVIHADHRYIVVDHGDESVVSYHSELAEAVDEAERHAEEWSSDEPCGVYKLEATVRQQITVDWQEDPAPKPGTITMARR